MTSVVRVWSGLVLMLAVVTVPALAGDSEQLQAAIDLFERQEYKAAQEALLKVERDKLDEAERARLDELLKLVPEAIQANEKAVQDLAAGDKAYEAGEWDTAEGHYRAVSDNPYALVAAREHAAAQCERIAEKKKLAEAAKPTGVVEESVVTTTAEETEGEPAAAQEPPPAEGPGRLTPTDELRIRDALLWQRAVAQAQALVLKTREAMANNNFVEARRLAAHALQTIEAAASYAEPVSKYQVAREEMLRLKQEVEQGAEHYAGVKAAQEREEIAARIAKRRELVEQQKAEKVQQLFNSAEQLRREKRFAEAAEVIRQILRLDPANPKARYQLEVAEDYESFAEQADWRRDIETQRRRALTSADEALIPWDVDVLYPTNWLALTAHRILPGGVGQGLEDMELNRRLNETLPEIRFDDQPFEQVVDFLTDMTKINISVDWTDLDDNGIERERPVTVRLSNLTFRTILKEVLSQVGGEVQLAYTVGEGLLRIATKEKLDRDKLILIYDIRDLLVTIPNQAMPDLSQSQGLQQGGQGSGGGIFGQQQGQGQQQQQQQYGADANRDLVERITDIIRQTVEPDSWRETGGGDGSIRELNGQLIIYNTSDAHRMVRDLLSQLREQQSLQISVESRFLDVTANFLEQFGVDLDFVFNAGTAGYDRATDLVDPFTGAPVLVPRQYSRIGTFATPPVFGTPFAPAPGVPVPQQPYGQAAFVPRTGGVIPSISEMTPISAQQGSLSLVDPSSANTQVPGSWAQRSGLQPALNITGSFLDNLQVDFLIRATQANAHSSIVQAPRLVIFNGQASQIRVERIRRYVASLEPVVGDNAALPRPIPDDANSGVSMWVQGVIAADRRYVTLSLAVLQQGEPSFERYELQRGMGNSPSIFLLLPSFARTVLMTTVSVPDGGTVLLGGLKQVGEVEMEAGIPILSKIPILKRAFTNSTTVKDTRTLLILVKAKIIIQREAEEEAFPTFSRLGQ